MLFHHAIFRNYHTASRLLLVFSNKEFKMKKIKPTSKNLKFTRHKKVKKSSKKNQTLEATRRLLSGDIAFFNQLKENHKRRRLTIV